MFTYLNPNVRKRLAASGTLFRIDRQGRILSMDDSLPGNQLVINLLGPIPLPLKLHNQSHEARWYAAVRSTELDKVESLASELRKTGGENLFSKLASFMAVNSILMIGDPARSQDPMVRVHSNCLTGDVFGSERCECGPQFALAVERISANPGGGMIVYMAGHEGRGIGLWAKAATYLLQDAGENTYQANESLGLPTDSRDFSDAASLILHFLGNRPFRLLTNNPNKIRDLETAGLTKISVEQHIAGVSKWNRRYLSAKQSWGHTIGEAGLTPGPETGSN